MKKNIWVFNHYIVPPSIEFGHRHNKFAKYLVKDGYEVNLFFSSAIHNTNKNLIAGNEKYLIEDTNQGRYIAIKTRSYFGNGKKRILNICDYFSKLFTITKLIAKKNGRPDIIIASSVHPLTCVAGILIAKMYNIKCICEIRDLWPLTLVQLGRLKEKNVITKFMYKLEHWIYKKADAIVFTMEGGRDYIIEKNWDKDVDINKVYHINNGVDLEEFNYNLNNFKLNEKDLNDEKTFKIIYTGSMGRANNVMEIVKCAEILKSNESIKFLLYGDGYERNSIEQYCKTNEINNVLFKGKVNKKYIPYILSKSDCNIFVGNEINLLKYGISLNKMFDYFASQKPLITNVDSNYNIIKKFNCGITVKGGNAEALADGILKFYNMPKYEYDRYCENALKAAQEYDFKKLTKDLENIIISLI